MRVLILGSDPKTLKESYTSVNLISYGIRTELEKFSNVQVISEMYWLNDFPEVDFVIVIIYEQDKFDFKLVKEKTKCKKIVTLREIKFMEADHCFMFNTEYSRKYNATYIKFPCLKSVLERATKDVNSVLVDHYWPPYIKEGMDWTYRIENWLEPYAGKRLIAKMVKDNVECEYNTRDWMRKVYLHNYPRYLDETKRYEKFIVTHHESFPYGVIDMAARGVKVLAPKDFVPKIMVDKLKIDTFTNKIEFLECVNKPVADLPLIETFADYSEVADIVMDKFKQWM